jgi:hypothetical protein
MKHKQLKVGTKLGLHPLTDSVPAACAFALYTLYQNFTLHKQNTPFYSMNCVSVLIFFPSSLYQGEAKSATRPN